MAEHVVVDASVAVMWGLPESHSPTALQLAKRWAEDGVHIMAPPLLLDEVANAIYKRVYRKEIDLKTADQALENILGFEIELQNEVGMHSRAMDLAHQLRQATVYDCLYLALAERNNCTLWTSDKSFCAATRNFVVPVKNIVDLPL